VLTSTTTTEAAAAATAADRQNVYCRSRSRE
jgi:hypothetical protein